MKKLFVMTVSALFLMGLISCRQEKQTETQDGLIMSVLWFQKSAEVKALFLQSYNNAEQALLRKLEGRNDPRPPAVVMDIDETILDNSPVEVEQIRNNIPFSDSLWLAWVNLAEADLIPGAGEFINLAASKGVEVFYVTNRQMPEEYEPTLQNLKKHNLPFADSLHLILKTTESSKERRREEILKKYEIVLLIGDNLADLSKDFDSRDGDLGYSAVSGNSEKFGADWIILPNPMYGHWVSPSIKGAKSESRRDKYVEVLRGFSR